VITRKIRVQLAVFLLIAAVGVTYVGGRYAGLDRLFDTGGYRVTVELADSGGIFENAEVTYRGVAVGRVVDLRLTSAGVAVELDVDDTAPPIPAAARAVIANRSAIGEQFVDLQPDDGDPPYLADGSVIALERTSLPPRTEDVLAHLDGLVTSVPIDSVQTVVEELGTAFDGAGPPLQRLLDGGGAFVDTATEHLPQTVGLLADGRTVLATQEDQSAEILGYSKGLRQIAEQLSDSDPDLRRVITASPRVARHVEDLLRRSGSDMSMLIANLLTVSEVTESRTDAIEELLVAFPVINAFTPSTAPDGRGHLGLVLNFFDPLPCTKGYDDTVQRRADDLTTADPNYDVRCAEPETSPISVRGAQNAPKGDEPDGAVEPGGAAAEVGSEADQAPEPPRLPGPVGLVDGGGAGTLAQLLGLP
jgi:phospholipid/cholesterol/gamma-HCH transport system substrate-binding protein